MGKVTKECKRRKIIVATLGARRQGIATPSRYPDGAADEGCPAISAGEFYPSGDRT